MKRVLSLILIAAGVLLVVGGFLYDMMFAGIPYQDPTPELSAQYGYHTHIASVICWIGAGVLLAGLVAGIVRVVGRRPQLPIVS